MTHCAQCETYAEQAVRDLELINNLKLALEVNGKSLKEAQHFIDQMYEALGPAADDIMEMIDESYED